ncbi:MAG: diaminopimelate epimerase [Candidatus Schekmanbacteria bacterium]|nr:diaminopimelate epimerase [Candidatus Schekmanbacteria bacterium]
MQLSFVKMQGLGNDFVVLDGRGKTLARDMVKLSQHLCDRRLGIGADQLLILKESAIADFTMLIYNADGSQVQMCGNGIRCLARYIQEQGLSDKTELVIETHAGIIKPRLIGDEVEVDMGEPVLEAGKIPVDLSGLVIDHLLPVADKTFPVTCVSMGNPHCVIFVENVRDFPVTRYGSLIENHPLFPQRTNVEFIEIINEHELKMRVWERGSGETPACGTGACASVVASVLRGKTQRKVTVNLPGGPLFIHWSKQDNRVYMRGPAVTVFSGQIEVSVG